ncbi:MAG: NAD(P)/FAD-dependent oxidoreductase [Methanomassiliicoccales archaeon]|nr:MAG: NAD(P)/FAD-dependent oxidoreductase [Methanomassiliicoccales archaeon]
MGAGPAGLVAGECAAKFGAKVAVIDKKREVGSPVRCAEGLGHMSFERLGLKPTSDFVMNTVNKAVLISPKGRRLEVSVPYKEFSLYILDRSGFEKTLASRLNKAGGELLLGTAVTDLARRSGKFTGVETTQGDISAKVIIGADGVESRVGRLCGLAKKLNLNQIFACVQHTLVDLENADDHFEIHFGSKFSPGGYAWMFPKGKGEVNLGLGVLASTKKKPLELLGKFKEERAKSAHSIRLLSGCIPSTLPLPSTVRDNIILVGDAARQTNAVSGGGIANAILAAKIAGELSGKIVVEKRPFSQLAQYDRLWRGHLEKILIKKYKQRRFLEDDKENERMFKFLRLAAALKPIIPKGLIVRWLRPDF